MNADKDYYSLLGVIPSAEEAVIRAAYKALAQRYHPDRYQGGHEAAHRLMCDLNEAYSVLSDQAKRREYDRLRAGRTGDMNQDEADIDQESNAGDDPLDEGWVVACEYYPELIPIGLRLSQISWKLAYGYKAFMLEVKEFEQCEKFASVFERKFLEYHFGTNKEILEFARKLIFSNHKAATKALNRALTILGGRADPERVIRKISADFDLDGTKSRDEAKRREEARQRAEIERRRAAKQQEETREREDAWRARYEQKVFRCCPSCRALNDENARNCTRCGSLFSGAV